MITRLLRRAFPMLDLWLSMGAGLYALQRATAWRDDVQVVLYQGQIRVGAWNEYHWELDNRIGTCGVECDGDQWLLAAGYAKAIPYKQSNQAERPQGVSVTVTTT